MTNQIKIYFDGGCRPTNPGNKYGSFEVQLNGRLVFKANRIELGWGTNNEAEFDILIESLKRTANNLHTGGFNTSDYSITVFTDSTVVSNRIASHNGKGKSEAARRMGALTQMALSYLGQYKSHNIHWHDRINNERKFGH